MDNCKTVSPPSRSDFKCRPPRKTCPNQFIALLNTYHSNAMGICVFVKNQFFFAISFPKLSPNCRLCNSLVLMSFYQGIMPAQVPKTQELGRFAASFRRLRSEKSLASGGRSPLAPHQGLCPWTTLGALPPDPRYRLARELAMAWPLQ